MLQRIQSLYLLAAMIMVLLLAFQPVVEILGPGNQLFEIRMSGIYLDGPAGPELTGTVWWALLILLAVITIIYPTAIFLYRKRLLQMRLCIFVILLLAGLTGLTFYFIMAAFRIISVVEHSYKPAIVFPVIAIILTSLALRAIRKDEELIRSINRIR